MTDPAHDGFLHRWSRRKTQARAGLPAADDAPADAAPEGGQALDDTGAVVQDASPADRQAAPEAPPLTLDDVRALTADSDFSPFVAARVEPQVKNAALKKLFSDPHYNVMDGLDVYIDDYSRMEPLPASLLRRLASARALDMFEPDAAAGPEAPQAAQGQLPPADPQGPPVQDAALDGRAPQAAGGPPATPSQPDAVAPDGPADPVHDPGPAQPGRHA